MKNIGVVGYSGKPFDREKALKLLSDVLSFAHALFDDEPPTLVISINDLGVPAIAFAIAKRYGWKVVGMGCEAAKEYKLLPVDRSVYVGIEWHEGSEVFIDLLDVLIRVGGGVQSHDEVRMAKERGIPVLEFELPVLV